MLLLSFSAFILNSPSVFAILRSSSSTKMKLRAAEYHGRVVTNLLNALRS